MLSEQKNPDADILLICDDDDEYSQGYAQIKETFRDLTKDDILQPYLSNHDFRSSNVGANDVGFNLCVFDIRYQHNFTAALQPIKVEF